MATEKMMAEILKKLEEMNAQLRSIVEPSASLIPSPTSAAPQDADPYFQSGVTELSTDGDLCIVFDVDGGGVDRLSRLPDPLLRNIVSRLPIRDAARTAVLSRRWSPIWRAAPLLVDNTVLLLNSNHLCGLVPRSLDRLLAPSADPATAAGPRSPTAPRPPAPHQFAHQVFDVVSRPGHYLPLLRRLRFAHGRRRRRRRLRRVLGLGSRRRRLRWRLLRHRGSGAHACQDHWHGTPLHRSTRTWPADLRTGVGTMLDDVGAVFAPDAKDELAAWSHARGFRDPSGPVVLAKCSTLGLYQAVSATSTSPVSAPSQHVNLAEVDASTKLVQVMPTRCSIPGHGYSLCVPTPVTKSSTSAFHYISTIPVLSVGVDHFCFSTSDINVAAVPLFMMHVSEVVVMPKGPSLVSKMKLFAIFKSDVMAPTPYVIEFQLQLNNTKALACDVSDHVPPWIVMKQWLLSLEEEIADKGIKLRPTPWPSFSYSRYNQVRGQSKEQWTAMNIPVHGEQTFCTWLLSLHETKTDTQAPCKFLTKWLNPHEVIIVDKNSSSKFVLSKVALMLLFGKHSETSSCQVSVKHILQWSPPNQNKFRSMLVELEKLLEHLAKMSMKARAELFAYSIGMKSLLSSGWNIQKTLQLHATVFSCSEQSKGMKSDLLPASLLYFGLSQGAIQLDVRHNRERVSWPQSRSLAWSPFHYSRDGKFLKHPWPPPIDVVSKRGGIGQWLVLRPSLECARGSVPVQVPFQKPNVLLQQKHGQISEITGLNSNGSAVLVKQDTLKLSQATSSLWPMACVQTVIRLWMVWCFHHKQEVIEVKPLWSPPAGICLFGARVTKGISFTIDPSKMTRQQLNDEKFRIPLWYTISIHQHTSSANDSQGSKIPKPPWLLCCLPVVCQLEIPVVLVKWDGWLPEVSFWKDADQILHKLSSATAWGQAVFYGGRNVRNLMGYRLGRLICWRSKWAAALDLSGPSRKHGRGSIIQIQKQVKRRGCRRTRT